MHNGGEAGEKLTLPLQLRRLLRMPLLLRVPLLWMLLLLLLLLVEVLLLLLLLLLLLQLLLVLHGGVVHGSLWLCRDKDVSASRKQNTGEGTDCDQRGLVGEESVVCGFLSVGRGLGTGQLMRR